MTQAGATPDYAAAARRMLVEQRLVHVVGCYTSSSRKEVLPLFEKHDGLLWYPSHYEGFESSDNVVYTGAAPNQHIVPLAEHLLRQWHRAYCVGSNYIWAWENNKIMREAVLAQAAPCWPSATSRSASSTSTRIVGRSSTPPDFVFNTLIGDSAYAFFRAFRGAAGAQASTRAATCRSRAAASPSPSWSRSAPKPPPGISARASISRVSTAGQPRLRRGVPEPLSGRRRHLGRCGGVLPRDPSAGPCLRRAGTTEMTAVRRPCRTSTSTRRRAGPYRSRQPPLLPHAADRNLDRGDRLRGHLRGARPVHPDPYLVWHELPGDTRRARTRRRLCGWS